MPLAQDLQIDGDDQRRAFGVLGPRKQPLHEVVVAQRVDLEPERGRGVLGDVLDGADRQRGERERHPEPLGGAGGLDLAVGALHAGQPHRRQPHRHGDVLPGHPARDAAPVHVHGDALAQPDLGEIGAVVAEGLLGPAA